MDSKDLLIEASFRLFLDKGYKTTSMSDLVKDTAYSKGAFYHYFENKEELFKEVIDRYFLSYYAQLDWAAIDKLNRQDLEQMIKEFYLVFVPDILSTTNKGMSRYFILFFETYTIYPFFKETVQVFYSKLKDCLAKSISIDGSEGAEIEAIRIIAKYEGLMFWLAVHPESDIQYLINNI